MMLYWVRVNPYDIIINGSCNVAVGGDSAYRNMVKDGKLIDCVVQMNSDNGPERELVFCSINDIPFMCVSADDEPDYDISQWFDEIFAFVETYHDHQSGLIALFHCTTGVSRSVTACISYMMRKRNIGWGESHAHIYMSRKSADPNEGFCRQLQVYEDKLARRTPVSESESESESESDSELEVVFNDESLPL